MRSIELLAPARNLESGKVAIDHGADAVYIGAYAFGARQAAGNDIGDIELLANYAHQFGAKVYVTLNTIVYEQELDKVRQLLTELANINVDAILIQDMAVKQIMDELRAEGLKMPHMHASTQTDNRGKDKVKWLAAGGFERVVLARELSTDEIADIHQAVPEVELEVFVHGALCVSYSGACYASEHFFHRSANRGECAQFCRLPFDLVDAQGSTIMKHSHLLSLKDMKQIDRIGDIVRAGASSLKIEGRLKDETYVKNVVAAYSMALDKFIADNPKSYCRASFGKCRYSFEPCLDKAFNRGYTHYFLDGRQPDISSPQTPKAMGEYVGYVKELRRGSFNVAGTAAFANGDGLCFFNSRGQLEGLRINKAVGNRLFPLSMPQNLMPNTALYRNYDIAFERTMAGKTAERKMLIDMTLHIKDGRLCLTAHDEAGRKHEVLHEGQLDKAQKPQRENILKQLGKLGNTCFAAGSISIGDKVEALFVPSSVLAQMRREATEAIAKQGCIVAVTPIDGNDTAIVQKRTDAARLNIANVSNHVAHDYYETHNIDNATAAYETLNKTQWFGKRAATTPLMTCRYCLRYAMGHCTKRGGTPPKWKEPLYLVADIDKRVRLVFNCAKCQMEVYAD